MAEQMSLPLAGRGMAAPLSWYAVKREERRRIANYARRGVRLSLNLGTVAQAGAVLDQMRRQARLLARRPAGRKNRSSMAAFLCTPNGRRLHAGIERWSARVSAQEAALCG